MGFHYMEALSSFLDLCCTTPKKLFTGLRITHNTACKNMIQSIIQLESIWIQSTFSSELPKFLLWEAEDENRTSLSFHHLYIDQNTTISYTLSESTYFYHSVYLLENLL